MKYQVGDKVRVRTDLVEERKDYYMENSPYSDFVNEDMIKLSGKEVIIADAGLNGYRIQGCVWRWTDEMFEGFAEDESLNDFNMSDLQTFLV